MKAFSADDGEFFRFAHTRITIHDREEIKMRLCHAAAVVSGFAIIVVSIQLFAQSQLSSDQIFKQEIEAEHGHDVTTRFNLCKQLADRGDVRGQTCLSSLYIGLDGIRKNPVEFRRYLRLAAEQGDAGSQDHLGFGLDNGFYAADMGSVPINKVEAAKWYRKAADQGHAGGQAALARLLFEGKGGVPKDDVQAYMWVTLAIENTHWPVEYSIWMNGAKNMKSYFARRMTGEQIAKAEHLIQEFKPNPTKTSILMHQAALADPQTHRNEEGEDDYLEGPK